MAKNTKKNTLTPAEIQAIEKLKADEQDHIEKAPERHNDTVQNLKSIDDFTSEIRKSREMPKDSAEYLKLKRQRRQN